MRHISSTLGKFLPRDYESSIEILKQVSPKLDNHMLENMIFQDFVEVYGINHFDISLNALEHFTKNSSSEFAIRAFILKDEDRAMKKMILWSKSSNHHIRRLSSEGSRPRLPWAVALPNFKKDPSKILPILELLKDDEELYVRKSVANNLNDISKDNPDIVIQIAKKWLGHNKNRDWIVKHGCRTLLKEGNTQILNLFGFKSPKNINIKNFQIQKDLYIGDDLKFGFDIYSHTPLEKLRIEYAVEFVRQKGKYSQKVFKIGEGIYDTNQKSITKKHSFKLISTRRYYAGVHKIHIILNGHKITSKSFILHNE